MSTPMRLAAYAAVRTRAAADWRAKYPAIEPADLDVLAGWSARYILANLVGEALPSPGPAQRRALLNARQRGGHA